MTTLLAFLVGISPLSGGVVPAPVRWDALPKAPTVIKSIDPGSDKYVAEAKLLADEIDAKTGIRLPITRKPSGSSIRFRVEDRSSGPEGYHLDTNKGVQLTASTKRGLAWGAVTILQSIQVTNAGLALPDADVWDTPKSSYRGLMIDVARRYHSIDVLKQCVELCRFYKLNYLQLHLSDDQSFTFPSKAFPLINTQNQHGGPSYTVAELKDLVKFADLRGVTIVPEMDIPGHSATLIRTMPDLFKIKGTKPYEHHATINFANKDVIKAVDTLIGEMCDVFHTSPYFHMGGDEADISLVNQHPDFQAAIKELGLPVDSQQELFRRFLGQVDTLVKKRGKHLMVWEGFGQDRHSKFPIPSDVLVMEFENSYYLPQDLLQDGYSLINASWTPLYVVNRHVWPARKVFDWDVSQFGRFGNTYPATTWFKVPDASRVQGAQVCSWEGPEELEIENLRRIVAAMAVRTWSGTGPSFEQMEPSLKKQDEVLELLVHPFVIRNSDLDAVDPNGYDVPCFTKRLVVGISPRRGGTIHVTLDGSVPTASSPVLANPIFLTKTTTIRAAFFDVAGKRVGYENSKAFYYVAPHEVNLAVGKKATASSAQGPQGPELAVDDNVDLYSSWWASPAPQWLKVDLGKPFDVDRVEVLPYWDGSRYYQYTVEVSLDGASWAQVADRSANTVPGNEKADEIKLGSRLLRYVKVNMLHGSANEGVHIVELRVWEAKH